MTMKTTRSVVLVSMLGLSLVGCTQENADNTADRASEAAARTQEAAEKAADATKNTAERVADKTVDLADKTVDKTKNIAGQVVGKTKEVSKATADVVTDGWITTTITAKFADETILDGSRINVDTNDHVVTLKGSVRSAAAKAKAESVAKDTRGVTRVVNQVVVK